MIEPYWQQGKAVIYLGNCAEVLPQIEVSTTLVLTDPPYAAGAKRGEWRTTASVAIGLHQAANTVRDKGAMLVFAASSGRGFDFAMGAVSPVLAFNRLLIWHKEFVRSRVAGPWRWDIVAILAFGRASFGRPEQSSVFTSKGPCSSRHLGSGKHPAELPDGIADWLYGPFDQEGAAVLDPFCGTAQLLVPALRAGRRVVGIDNNEAHCETAAKRLEREV